MENIKSKIRKLITLANNDGATEAEAAQAMEMASALMLKHNIDMAPECDESEVWEGPTVFNSFDERWHAIASQAAGVLFMCEAITRMPRGRGFYFVGRKQNTEMAADLFESIAKQVERLYKENLPKDLSVSERAEFRRTFKQACAGRVYHRCWKIVDTFKKEGLPEIEHSKSTALMVINSVQKQLDEVKTFIDSQCKDIVFKKAKPLKSGMGSFMGRNAGDKVQLNKQVS